MSFRSLAILLVFLLVWPMTGWAKEATPQWWSFEIKGGAWLPRQQAVKDFVGCCEPVGLVEFGFLWRSLLGLEVGIGLIDTWGQAVGGVTGETSEDQFNFLILPIVNNVTFRADFKEEQFAVPYVKFGPDYVIFRENLQGEVTKGVKYGLHGAGGVQILLDGIEGLSTTLEREVGINDVYFVAEGRYAWVNSFGGGGLNLSSWTFSGGFLFEF